MKQNLFILFTVFAIIGFGQAKKFNIDSLKINTGSVNKAKEKTDLKTNYGEKGWELSTEDGNFKLQFQSRLQFRYSTPYETDPITFDDFRNGTQNSFRVTRARIKLGGNAYKPWLKYYWEYDLASNNLLDFRLMLSKTPYLNVKVGQWKVQYNRERIISSGKQQLVDRSHITRPFTIDRQQGISFYGNLKGNSIANFNYWASIFTGTGRGAKKNDDNHMMYMLRGQWNFLGRSLKFQGSDTKYHEEGAGIIALAAVTNRSPYTRFSTAGGGQLNGFKDGDNGQYRVNQWMAETAYMFRGFSWQQEYHWKEIKDYKNITTTTMIGNYAQLGYFFHHMLNWVPREMEIAFRHAFYIPDLNITTNMEQELTTGVNWFFNDHTNKLSAELSYFYFQDKTDSDPDGFRFRVQWDISM